MEIDKYSKPGPKIDEDQRETVNGNVGQKIYRCRKKKSRGESHINLTGNAKINEFQSESMEIDKYSKLGPKIDEGQRKQLINRSGPENTLMPLETTGGQLKPTGQTRATNNSQATQTSRQTPPYPPPSKTISVFFWLVFLLRDPSPETVVNGFKRFATKRIPSI